MEARLDEVDKVNVSSRRTSNCLVQYHVAQSVNCQDEWTVEAINFAGDGEVYKATFSGPNAQQRAEEYAEWVSAKSNPITTH